MGDVVRTHRDLLVWQKGMVLCFAIYRSTRSFPDDERFGLAQELRKTARSVVANIAEGNRRESIEEYLRHLDIADGSVAELETQLLIARELGYLVNGELEDRLREIDAMLAALIRALRRTANALDP